MFRATDDGVVVTKSVCAGRMLWLRKLIRDCHPERRHPVASISA
jgi:hypothetical protein